jgi:subtilisin family serine protease
MLIRSIALVVSLFASLAVAGPWIWDTDGDKIDDRIESVQASGLAAGFENNDPTLGRMIIGVAEVDGIIRYSVYVGYEQHPTEADLATLRNSGVSTVVWYAFQTIPYVQMELTYPEIEKVTTLSGVERVEAVEMMYPVNNVATKASGVKDSRYARFPTVHGNLALTGDGIVISILDTGVNDQADSLTGFPGHEAVAGKFIAGGNFYSGQPALNTKPNESENPIDRGPDTPHGSHVAGTALGTGGPTAVFGGVAPASRLVDEKVLSDAGAGFGSASGVEWAILNKDRYNIRVLNLSLGGLTASDGRDAGSRAINAAFDAGLIAVVASGNDSRTGYMPSPAAADKAFTVGALADQNSIGRADDLVASFSNEGPRLSDGDADFTDEMKPLVAAPGSGIVSADGTLTTDGRQYTTASGTSMATPHTAGIVALILQANPALTPSHVWEILKHTSEHRKNWGKTPEASNPFPTGDPNYHPSGGWGQVDAYAAVKEALRLKGDPASQTQVVFINATPAADGAAAIDVTWKSQREINLSGYEISRADDVSGGPGTFSKIAGPFAGVGQATIEGVNNRNTYSYRDESGLTSGNTYWYRIDHISSDPAVGTIQEPPLAVTLGAARAVAKLAYSITHNAIDNDLLTLLGTGVQAERAKFIIDGKSALQADKITEEAPTNTGSATVGTRRHDFSINLTSRDAVEPFLPPSKSNRWFLSVKEGGFLNRSGRVNGFSLTTFDASGNPTTYSTGDPVPQETVEGLTTKLWIPDNPDVYVLGDSPAPAETDPSSGAQGASSMIVDIYGGEFAPNATASFGNGVTVQSVEYKSGSQLRATISIGTSAAAGPRDVTVTNADGRSGTAPNAFTVTGTGGGCTVVVQDYDDADPVIEYGDGWHRRKDAAASNGGYHRRVAASPNATAARIVFRGTQVTFFYATSDSGGSADVYLDGALVESVSFAGTSKNPAFGASRTYGPLADASHELRILARSGIVYVDGFQASGCEPNADASAVESRSTTESSTAALSGLPNTVILRTVEVGAHDRALSVNVDGATHPVTVNILDPAGTVLATGSALLAGQTISGAETAVSHAGTYTVQVIDVLGLTGTVDISVARSVKVK